ncbi:homocysteine S-methyltransferase 1-like, partial [Rhincodon typus]|uniref:homocysteine S-methyltransferase 1-like n=1 Tax=Rhincodon typus TaxID=259920 RepID=UPI002030979E
FTWIIYEIILKCYIIFCWLLQELKTWHRPQMQSLITAGVDLIAMETIPSQKEGEALVELLKEFPNAKAWLSFSVKDGKCISHGENFEDAVKFAIKSDQLVSVGLNCCSPDIISPLLISANKARGPEIGWIVYPNSGETWDSNTRWWRKSVNNQLAKFALEWKELGAKWIGGCCRTTPADIAELRRTLTLNLSHD